MESNIQWTKYTWNPWHGCKKVSAGCKFCYMYRDKKTRFGQDPSIVQRSKPATFNSPLKWKDPSFVFTCSWSDFFIAEADEWRNEAWDIIRKTPHLIYQILTKRPERIKECLPPDWGDGWHNVWIGVSAEDQDSFDFRVPILCDIPATIRFLSLEPLLGPITMYEETRYYGTQQDIDKIHWVIIGGESGNENGEFTYRKCDIKWIEDLIFQCNCKGIACFVKQTGTYISKQSNYKDRHGGDILEWPLQIQSRVFPEIIFHESLFL